MSAYEDALYQLELAEAELALLKQELVYSNWSMQERRSQKHHVSSSSYARPLTSLSLCGRRPRKPGKRPDSLEMRFKLITLECSL